MARLNHSLFIVSGKLGNVVFSKWRDIMTLRSYQANITDANSTAQQKQRSRMVSLLNFLKPLNKTFIKFYNSNCCKESTPWAQAIKDNMKAVASDGCIIPENISFGNPKFPPFEILEATYDPFIDLLRIKYKPVDLSGRNDPYPYIDVSVLGRYKSDPNNPTFDTRHLLKGCIDLTFECYSWDGQCEHTWTNHYSDGWCWFIYVDSDCMENIKASNWNTSSPAYFEPKPIIDGFNNDFVENLVPVDAISWKYEKREDIWYLIFSIDLKKTSIENPEDYTLIFWGLGFTKGKYEKTDALEWNLSESTIEFEVGSEGLSGSMISLYSVFTNEGEQVSMYNRIYINSGTDGIEHNLYNQLFDSNYATPVSYVLDDNHSGICGSIDELFGEFIQLYNQGMIYDHSEKPVREICALKAYASGNGTIDVDSYIYKDKLAYYFYKDETAYMTVIPMEGHKFDVWLGDDAADVVSVSENTYSIVMSKERNVSASFIIIP